MPATIKIKNSSTASAVPTSSDLVQGELAVNVTDRRLFTENAGGTVVELGTNPTILTMGAAGSASAPVITRTGDTNTGIFFPAADTIAFAEGGVEAMRLDSSGNMGLGVTPSAWSTSFNIRAFQLGGGSFYSYNNDRVFLGQNVAITGGGADVYLSSAAASTYRQYQGTHAWYNAPSGTTGNAISFTQAMTLDASGNLLVGGTSARDTGGTRSISINSGALAAALDLTCSSGRSYAIYTSSSATGLQFYDLTANAERARIDSSGNLLVGSSSQPVSGATGRIAISQSIADYSLVSYNTNATPYGIYQRYSTDPNNTGTAFYTGNANGTLRFEVRSNGGIANYSANNANLSDRREKTNFAPAKSYLDVICSIPVQTYNYIDQNLEEDDGLTLGVVAQDVQAVAPELVMESNWGTQEEPKMRLSIYQTDLQYALMKCIQELKAEVDSLKAQIAGA